MQAYAAKVLIKAQGDGDRKEMKHLIQLMSNFPNHNFNFDYWYTTLFTISYYHRCVREPVGSLE